MLDPNFVRENISSVSEAMRNRGATEALDLLEKFALADKGRRSAIAESDKLNAERNEFSHQIGALMKEGKSEQANALRSQVNTLKERIAGADKHRDQAETEMSELLESLPNIPHQSVPIGKDESANREEQRQNVPPKPQFDFEPKDHVDLATDLWENCI